MNDQPITDDTTVGWIDVGGLVPNHGNVCIKDLYDDKKSILLNHAADEARHKRLVEAAKTCIPKCIGCGRPTAKFVIDGGSYCSRTCFTEVTGVSYDVDFEIDDAIDDLKSALEGEKG